MVVTFNDQVEVFFIDNNEDRKSHWQQIARERMRFQRRIQATNHTLGVVFEISHKLQFHKRIQDVNETIGYVFAKSHRHRMLLYIDECKKKHFYSIFSI